jgi:hypothetical protein
MRESRCAFEKPDGGSLRRDLANRTEPILDMVGPDHLASFKRVNVDRHQFE